MELNQANSRESELATGATLAYNNSLLISYTDK